MLEIVGFASEEKEEPLFVKEGGDIDRVDRERENLIEREREPTSAFG